MKLAPNAPISTIVIQSLLFIGVQFVQLFCFLALFGKYNVKAQQPVAAIQPKTRQEIEADTKKKVESGLPFIPYFENKKPGSFIVIPVFFISLAVSSLFSFNFLFGNIYTKDIRDQDNLRFVTRQAVQTMEQLDKAVQGIKINSIRTNLNGVLGKVGTALNNTKKPEENDDAQEIKNDRPIYVFMTGGAQDELTRLKENKITLTANLNTLYGTRDDLNKQIRVALANGDPTVGLTNTRNDTQKEIDRLDADIKAIDKQINGLNVTQADIDNFNKKYLSLDEYKAKLDGLENWDQKKKNMQQLLQNILKDLYSSTSSGSTERLGDRLNNIYTFLSLSLNTHSLPMNLSTEIGANYMDALTTADFVWAYNDFRSNYNDAVEEINKYAQMSGTKYSYTDLTKLNDIVYNAVDSSPTAIKDIQGNSLVIDSAGNSLIDVDGRFTLSAQNQLLMALRETISKSNPTLHPYYKNMIVGIPHNATLAGLSAFIAIAIDLMILFMGLFTPVTSERILGEGEDAHSISMATEMMENSLSLPITQGKEREKETNEEAKTT